MPTLYLFLHGRDPCISPTSRVYLAYISEQEDHMTSFFLAETLKYLYLLFDEAS